MASLFKNTLIDCSSILRICLVALAISITSAAPAWAAAITHTEISKTLEAISIDGELVSADVEKFRALSLQYPDGVVILDSPGGALFPAIEIGKMIRLTGYSTLVADGSDCTSSCALIWLAGARRMLSPKGRVGFHASYLDNDGKLEETGVGNAVVGHYLTLLNLSQKAIIFATLAGPTEINWLSVQNRASAGIEFEEFIIDGSSDGQAAKPPVSVVRTPPPITAVSNPTPQARKFSSYSLLEIESGLKLSLRRPSTIDPIVSAAKLDPANAAIFRNHLKLLYGSDMLVRRLASELYGARDALDGKNNFEMGKAIGQALVQKLSMKGMARLSDADVRSFLYYLALVPTVTTAAQCTAIFSQENTDSMLEFRAVAATKSGNFTEYLSLLRKAIFAELAQQPEAITVSESQKNLAESAFQDAIAREMATYPPEDAKRIFAAFGNLNGANEQDGCDAYFLIFKTMYKMDGMPGTWYRRSFTNDLEK